MIWKIHFNYQLKNRKNEKYWIKSRQWHARQTNFSYFIYIIELNTTERMKNINNIENSKISIHTFVYESDLRVLCGLINFCLRLHRPKAILKLCYKRQIVSRCEIFSRFFTMNLVCLEKFKIPFQLLL